MDLNSLPTDNLYKFMFISGLAIILAASLIYIEQHNKLKENINKIGLEIEKSKIQDKVMKQEYARINKQYEKIKNTVIPREKRNQQAIKTYAEDLEVAKNELIGLRKKQLEIYNKEKVNTGLVKYKLKILGKENSTLTNLRIGAIIATIIGIILTGLGYYRWNSLVQKLLDEKLKLEVEILRRHP